jgi:GT2 family glycosyltransferase
MLKNSFIEIGMLNKMLTDGEDYEFAVRAIKKDIPVYFDKDNQVIHKDAITLESYINRLRQYRNAHEQILTFHPELKKIEKKNRSVKKFIYQLFTCRLVYKIINNKLALFIPKSVRYRIYSIIIHAYSIEFPSKPIPS